MRKVIFIISFVVIAISFSVSIFYERSIDHESLYRLYKSPLSKPDGKLRVFHLGHSLVGFDMPFMVKQLSGEGHDYRSQTGWGARLEAHWDPDVEIAGYEDSNSHPYFQDVFEAIDSGSFDVYVLTEGVEIKDSIKYHDSWKYLAKFAEYIFKKNPDAQIYFYETWHELTDEQEWISRLDTDYDKYWLGEILNKALIDSNGEIPIYVIPVGQVMSALFKKVKSMGGINGLSGPKDIFQIETDGSLDQIHINDIGAYLVALTHYAVLYHRSPVGLPYRLNKASGESAKLLSAEATKLLQETVWEVVSNNYRTGIIGLKYAK